MNTQANHEEQRQSNAATSVGKKWREMLRIKEAAAFMGVSVSTLFRLADKHDDFPRKIRVSSRCCFYRRDDLTEWLKSREA
ncbi:MULTISPECIES: helix-turn-helix domain-containing protein [Idiomarina]|jgi:prophage regulatory protein|uniref:helix-turn-helix transcriptional regulator n=1 Tax=Idiomarina TaxID=135575 RepID=UPI0024200F09|nr:MULTISPECIES: helix-turn-helix domain-containing protein [Idiomarina]|tara:strand:+ start:2518 stop:2760 length:243 start_codon:yes stop_codon:yes gene_type:complete